MWRASVRQAARRPAGARRLLSGGGQKPGALSDFVQAMLKRRGKDAGKAAAGKGPAEAGAAQPSRLAEEELARLQREQGFLDRDDGEALPSEAAGQPARRPRRSGLAAGPFAGPAAGEVDEPSEAELAAALAEANRVVEEGEAGTEEVQERKEQQFETLPDTPLPTNRMKMPKKDAPPIPLVAKDLRRVVRQPGTHPMSDFDDKSQLHFPDYFSKVYQPSEVAWDAIPPFTTSSRDPRLMRLAEENGSRVACSTSSTTSLLAHLYFVFLRFRHINVNLFSPAFSAMPRSYTRATKAPAQTVLRRRGKSLWGMDSSPKYVRMSNEILMNLGKSMEYGAVMEPDEFKAEMLKSSKTRSGKDRSSEEHFRFVKMGSIMFRSQLDAAKDSRGEYVFDLKTRATNPIRMSIANYQKAVPYRLTKAHGVLHSFEREWFDMARSSFLKYVLQCRIGQMQGVMVTFHNTEEVFGFEHIPLAHMEEILFGSSDLADSAYHSCTRVLDRMLNEVTDRFKDDKLLKLTTFANRFTNKLTLFVERVGDETQASVSEGYKVAKRVDARAKALAEAAEVAPEDPSLSTAHFCLQNHILRLDWLSTAEVVQRLEKLGLSTEGARPQLVARLEDAEKAKYISPDSQRSVLPNAHFYRKLAEEGKLLCYEVEMRHYVGDGSRQILRRSLSPSDVGLIKTKYGLRDVTGDFEPAELAQQYRRFVLDMNSEYSGVDIPVPAEGEADAQSTYGRHLTHPPNRYPSSGPGLKTAAPRPRF